MFRLDLIYTFTKSAFKLVKNGQLSTADELRGILEIEVGGSLGTNTVGDSSQANQDYSITPQSAL